MSLREGQAFQGDGERPQNASGSNGSIALTHDAAQAAAFLRRFHPGRTWNLVAIQSDRKGVTGLNLLDSPDAEAALHSWLSDNPTANIHYHVADLRPDFEGAKASKADVVASRWLHVDVDPVPGADLAAERDRIIARLRAFSPPPTCIVFSGSGGQAFWRLAEPLVVDGSEEAATEVERYNRQLETDLGGDSCHNVDRIMRLPGTINWPNEKKRRRGQEPRPAELLEFDDERTYGTNSFRKAANVASQEKSGSSNSDHVVEQVDIDRVIPIVGIEDPRLERLDLRTKELIETGGDPARRSEEQFRASCEMVRQRIDDPTHYAVLMCRAFRISDTVYDHGGHKYALAQIRSARKKVGTELILLKNTPDRSAAEFRSRVWPDLVFYQEDWLVHSGASYEAVEDGAVTSELRSFLSAAKTMTAEGKIQPFHPKTRDVSEVYAALRDGVFRRKDRIQPPCWFEREAGDPDPRRILACRNGLLDLSTGELHPLTPRFFTRSALDLRYDPVAPPPEKFLRFLADLWPGNTGEVELLQEMFGYLLLPDTSQQKILLFLGPPRSGKGTLARVLGELVGEGNVCGPRIDSLGGPFGLEPLLGKQLAVVSDLRMSSKTDQAAIAENLLRISGEDSVSVGRKFKGAWEGTLPTRFLVMTNEVPKFTDASGALANRFVVLRFTESFLGREDRELTEKLLPELPGILNWAIGGWRRLNERGHFVMPASGKAVLDEIAVLAAPILAFLNDRCILDPESSTTTNDVYNEYREWCGTEGVFVKEKSVFGKQLKAACPRVGQGRRGGRGHQVEHYLGIRLRSREGREEGERSPF